MGGLKYNKMTTRQTLELGSFLRGMNAEALALMRIGEIHDVCVSEGYDVSKSSVRSVLDGSDLPYRKNSPDSTIAMPSTSVSEREATLSQAIIAIYTRLCVVSEKFADVLDEQLVASLRRIADGERFTTDEGQNSD
jgi:hypothetical protein